MKIAILGYGKMGKAIEQIALERGHEIVLKVDSKNADFSNDLLKYVKVAIEFSTPNTVINNIKKCFDVKIPVVVGTTGWNEQKEIIEKLAIAKNTGLFHASNFSIGVNIFMELNQKLAQLMNTQKTYEVKMEEIHHIHKLDEPSGTAITLAEEIIENIDRKTAWKLNEAAPNELQINSIRQGEVPGTHSVTYNSDVDDITITHTAKSRKGFALGAVIAAEYMQDKTGVHNMKSIIN